MLKVTVEIWPGGDESRSKTIGEAIIFNDGTSVDVGIGNYDAVFQLFEPLRPTTKARVENHDRTQDVFALLEACLAARA